MISKYFFRIDEFSANQLLSNISRLRSEKITAMSSRVYRDALEPFLETQDESETNSLTI